MLDIYFMKLNENAVVPTQSHDSDAGVDLYALYPIRIESKQSAVIHTGIAWGFQRNEICIYKDVFKPYLQVKSRSGMAFKKGLEVTNGGVIDADYRGEILVKIYNWSEEPQWIDQGERFAQVIPILIPYVNIHETIELDSTERGDKGFGSTGR